MCIMVYNGDIIVYNWKLVGQQHDMVNEQYDMYIYKYIYIVCIYHGYMMDLLWADSGSIMYR